MSLATQISQAVNTALSPSPTLDPGTRRQATEFLSQVKENAGEAWQECLRVFVRADGDYGPQERLFCAQVVGDVLPQLGSEARLFVLTTLQEHLNKEYIAGSAESGAPFLKNATARLATQLFLVIYPAEAPGFFKNLIALAHSYSPSTPPTPDGLYNPPPTEFLLRVLHEVSTEISDAYIRSSRDRNRTALDGQLRDAVRANDAGDVATAVWQIINEALNGVYQSYEGQRVGLRGAEARQMAEMAFRVVGDYVSWIDMNYIISPDTIQLFQRALHLADDSCTSLRVTAVEALIDAINKGMPAQDKLALLSVLEIPNLIGSLINVGRNDDGSRLPDSSTEDDVEMLRLALSKLLVAAGGEATKISEDVSMPEEARAAGLDIFTHMLPLALRLLSDDNRATILATVPFVSNALSLFKKQRKRAAHEPNQGLTETKTIFLTELIQVAFRKLEFDDEDDWRESVEAGLSDDQSVLESMRKNFGVVMDNVAAVAPALYRTAVEQLVLSTCEAYSTRGAEALPWQTAEVALFNLYSYGSALSLTGSMPFVQISTEENQKVKSVPGYQVDYTKLPLSPVGEMMLRVCQARLGSYPNDAVALQFFEVASRYHEFFKLCPEIVGEVLPAFLGSHGVHQSAGSAQERVFYLLNRFVFYSRATFQSQVSAEHVSGILGQFQDLLVIRAELPEQERPGEDILVKAASGSRFFKSQLDLYETMGTLISILNQVPEQQVTLLRTGLMPLITDLQASVRTSIASVEDVRAIVQAHHLIMAVGSIAKGFPDTSSRGNATVWPWMNEFKQAAEAILACARAMGSFSIVREAARHAFTRLIGPAGETILPTIPPLIETLLGQVALTEVGDVLSLVGQCMNKFKASFVDVLDAIIYPVFERIWVFLERPIDGTDDKVDYGSCLRAYFAFIAAITSAELGHVFLSDKNKDNLHLMLNSVVHYTKQPQTMPTEVKAGFGVLHRLGNLWLAPWDKPETTPVPGFERFYYDTVLPLCFEIPLRSSFDFYDAQSSHAVDEISQLLKMFERKRGPEFASHLEQTFMPSINCPPELAQQFVVGLRDSADGKPCRKFVKDFFQTHRGEHEPAA